MTANPAATTSAPVGVTHCPRCNSVSFYMDEGDKRCLLCGRVVEYGPDALAVLAELLPIHAVRLPKHGKDNL